MTEAEWVICTDPRLLLVFLEGKASERKARLYACGLGRFLWPFLGDERSRRVVEMAEKYADKLATDPDLATSREAALDAKRGAASQIVAWVGDRFSWQAARMVVVSIQQTQNEVDAKDWIRTLSVRSRRLLHCVFSNPFRSFSVDPAWLMWNDGTVRRIAQAVYEDRTFDQLPVLADALEEAGCTSGDLLAHCREPGPHVRGCWAVDLILGNK